MRAVLLANGYGTRLRPLTWFVPKCMVKVQGKPVLEYLVEYLESYNIKEIMVNLHYKPNQVMKYFGTRLLYFYEPHLLGEYGTIDKLSSWLQDDYTVIMNGDTLTNLDLNQMFRLSKGKNIRSMDNGVYTGLQILSPDYFKGDKKFINYQSKDTWWTDIGTYKGLLKANKFDAKKLSSLLSVRDQRN